MEVLKKVYQDFGETATHKTQWSVVYNPAAMTAKICPRVEQTDKQDSFYEIKYDFNFKKEFEDSGKISYAVDK